MRASLPFVAGAIVRRALLRHRLGYPHAIDPCLAGACGIGGTILANALQRLGLPAVLVAGVFIEDGSLSRYRHHKSTHVWVELYGMIIDPTASQFDLANIYITPKQDPRYKAVHRGERAAQDVAAWARLKKGKREQSPILHPLFVEKITARVVDSPSVARTLAGWNSPSPSRSLSPSSPRSQRTSPNPSVRSPS